MAKGDMLVSIQNIPAALCETGLGLGRLVYSQCSLLIMVKCSCGLSLRWSIYIVLGLPKV